MADRRKPETILQHSIMETLKNLGVEVIRIQCGRVKVRRGWMHGAKEGTPDLFLPFLRAVAETKTPKGKLSPEQITWHERARRAGVRVAVWRSAEDAVASVRQWTAADSHERAMGWDAR